MYSHDVYSVEACQGLPATGLPATTATVRPTILAVADVFDPEVVDAFIGSFDEFAAVAGRYRDD